LKTAAIIEARMASSRLPGKVLLPVLSLPMLGRLILRLKSIEFLDQIIVATTNNLDDDLIVATAAKYGADIYRGSESDVLGRVLEAAKKYDVDLIVEITGDCPIIDPTIVVSIIQSYFDSEADYVSNSNIRSYPDGMDVQVYRTNVLEFSSSLANLPLEREHVTLHIRQNPTLFKILDIHSPLEFFYPNLGLTLDTSEDLDFLTKIIESLEPKKFLFSLKDILDYLDKNSELLRINSHVIRKGDS
jgi:spore coat polysaccharide biosynthesis protein SpsF